jgi:hypothetical protein
MTNVHLWRGESKEATAQHTAALAEIEGLGLWAVVDPATVGEAVMLVQAFKEGLRVVRDHVCWVLKSAVCALSRGVVE